MSEGSHPPENWDVSSGPCVSFAGVPDDYGQRLQQLTQVEARAVLRREISDCSAVISRVTRLGCLAAKIAHEQRVPWALEVVGDAWTGFWTYGNLAAKLYAPIAYWQARKWIRKAPFAMFVTKEYLQRRYPCDGYVAGVSDVDIECLSPRVLESRIARTKRIYPNRSRPIRCGLIGDLSARYKGVHLALRALMILRDRGITIHLHNLGEGDLKAWMSEAKRMGASELLHLDGARPSGSAVAQWLDEMDLYIQPSLSEGMPRALIEAMSRALPCLASTVGGIPELLTMDCMHKPGDYRRLAIDLERMIVDLDWRVSMAARNFATARGFYRSVLDPQRDVFWQQFAAFARNRANFEKQTPSSCLPTNIPHC